MRLQPDATVGGAAFGIIAAIRSGRPARPVLQLAGAGSAARPCARRGGKDPHEQGVVAMIGVFVDTIIVVTMTALVVLSVLYVGDGTLATGDYATLTAETITKTNIAQLAFGQFFGANVGAWFVAICLHDFLRLLPSFRGTPLREAERGTGSSAEGDCCPSPSSRWPSSSWARCSPTTWCGSSLTCSTS
ncbi:MAG: alanine:cation symporter family protein [Adlercreutzia equolifaciens]